MRLRWKRHADRVYWGLVDGEMKCLVFGSPAPRQLWCWAVWFKDGRKRSGFALSFADAKREGVKALFNETWGVG